MREYFENFLEEFNFPDDAKPILIEGFNKIEENEKLKMAFLKFYAEYEKNIIAWEKAVDDLSVLSEKINLHKYTVRHIFFICMSKHTKTLYEKKGLSYSLFKDTFSDLIYKLNECKKQYGVWGTSVPTFWYAGFLNLERFALGRLQYEAVPYFGKEPYTKNGVTINPGDLVLNTHIPSSGPLTEALVEESFRLAYEFYKDTFKTRYVPIVCSSWLLFPKHYDMLSENSNIVKFMNKFDIVSHSYISNYDSLFMTLFNRPYDDDLNSFPQDTSIQRAYIKLAKENKPRGEGIGIAIYRGK